jgi:hypothetical protein
MAVRPKIHGALAAVLVWSLTACTVTAAPAVNSPTSASAEKTGTPAPTPATPTTTEMPYLTVTPVLELNDQTTKPGAKLKFGEQAVVPFYSRYAKGLLGISVTVESVKAPDADIDQLPLKDEDKAKLRGKMFFFVKQTLTNLDGANFAEIQAPIISASTKSGGFPGTLLGMAKISVTGCEEGSFAPSDFATKGAKYEVCRLNFGVASDPVTSLSYNDKPYERADGKSVTWRK